MASHANSIAAPQSSPPSLGDLRNLFCFADSARLIIQSTAADDALDAICDQLLHRLIREPVGSVRDLLVKLWLLETAGERDWDYEYCSRHVLGQVAAYVRRQWK